MTTIVLPASTFDRLIERHTTATDRAMCRNGVKRLPDGSYECEIGDDAVEALREMMLEGETFADALERGLAIAAGQVS